MYYMNICMGFRTFAKNIQNKNPIGKNISELRTGALGFQMNR